MAVVIMSPRCRVSLVSLTVLVCVLQVFGQGDEPRMTLAAGSIFLRSKRANQFLLEEILPGNLERECYEELCGYEEAREYFEDNAKTVAFWTVYSDGDQCQPNPCLHGGNCTDKVGGFHCSCNESHHGPTCELGAPRTPEDRGRPLPAPRITDPEIFECPTEGPTACHQLCSASAFAFTCSCLPGFRLQSDGRSCLPKVKFPCGRLPHHTNATALTCRHGSCPWQVLLLDNRGVELCAGVLLGQRSVLTAAHCLQSPEPDPRPSDFYILAGNQEVLASIQAIYIHDRYRRDHHDNNLAVLQLASSLPFSPSLIHLCLPTKDFSENILMHSGRMGVVASQKQNLVYMTMDECRSQLTLSHPLSNKMFCVRSREQNPRTPAAPQNPNQTLQRKDGGQGTPNALVHSHTDDIAQSDGSSRSGVSSQRCSKLLPGTPIVTVERETTFLTGLLISTSADCHSGGLVFSKLSRYQNWIESRRAAIEDHVTSLVEVYSGDP
ncbi:protein Z, vitamin K-dependent plasma glycoprotein b [Aulostomus maculatus]